MSENKKIGDIIKELRLKKGITQNELASLLDTSPSAVGMYEQNKREPKKEILLKIAEVFNVSCDMLLKGENEDMENKLKTMVDDEVLTAFEDYSSWSNEDKEELLEFLTRKKNNK